MSGQRFPFQRRVPLLLCVTGAVAGTGLGLLGRRVLAKPDHGAAAQVSAVSEILSGPDSRQPVPARPSVPGKAGAEAIAASLAGEKGLDYWLHLLAAADGSSAEVISRLIDSLKDEPAALSLLGERWAQLDPDGMFAALKARGPDRYHFDSSHPIDELERILAQEWFKKSPESLISALNATDGPQFLPTAKEELLRLVSVKDPGRTLALIISWELPLRTIESNVLAPWLRANPREAMNVILARKGSVWRPGDGGADTLKVIARGMAEIDPAGTLGMPPAANRSLHSSFLDQVMKAWAERDLPAAAAWLEGSQIDQKTRNGRSRSLLQTWSEADPLAAITWADAHVTGFTRMQLNSTLIPALAARDAAGALEFVNGMTPGFARDEAGMQVTDSLLTDKGKEEILDNFQRITALSDPALRKAALEGSARRMMWAAPQEFLAWLAGPEGAEAPFRAFTAVSESLAEKDGEAAMKWAAGLRDEISAEVRQSVLYKWMDQEPEDAKTWLGSLPDGPERRNSITSATAFLGRKVSPESYTAWLDSLPASDHAAIQAGLAKVNGLDSAIKASILAKYR